MKKILKYLLIFILVFASVTKIKADDTIDMKSWSFTIIEQHCDQEDQIKVTKYQNSQTDNVGFCLEPQENYNRYDYVYTKQAYENKDVIDIVRAYEELGDDQHYIAAQLLIWESIYGARFSFSGKYAEDFGARDLKDLIASYQQRETETMELSVISGTPASITIEDLSDYTVESEDVQILSQDGNTLTFITDLESGNTGHIYLHSGKDPYIGAYLYASDGSQDLYSYEGSYETGKDLDIIVRSENEYMSLSFSKTNEEGKALPGTEFIIYDLDGEADETIYLLQKGHRVNLFEAIISDHDDYDEKDIEISISERYEDCLDDLNISCEEEGYFTFEILCKGESLRKGRVYVTDDPDLTQNSFSSLAVEKIKEYVCTEETINTIDGLLASHRYLLCETQPVKGYEYKGNPLILFDKTREGETVAFVNTRRTYTLKLQKNDPDRTILLNGARFSLKYTDGGEENELIFVTGALNIIRRKDYQYVVYCAEGSDDIKVKEFSSACYQENVKPGKYWYYETNDPQIDKDKLHRYSIEVKDGCFILEDLPYESELTLQELSAPSGYQLDSAIYRIRPDIAYSDIVYTNYRVNEAIIIPENRRPIPKTCIGD